MAIAPEMIVKPDESDLVRLKALEENIRVYDPGFDFNLVRLAYGKVKPVARTLRRDRTGLLIDHFTHDPLLIPERLVKDGNKPSSTDILTSLLGFWVRPPAGKLPDQSKMDWIKSEFDDTVLFAVQDFLRLRAQKFGEPASYSEPSDDDPDKKLTDEQKKKLAKDRRKEHLRQFKLLGLSITHSRSPIVVLGKAMEISQEIDIAYRKKTGHLHEPRKSRERSDRARYLIAPLAYIANYENMRDRLCDLAYEIDDPVGYKSTKEQIGRVAHSRKIKQARLGLIAEIERQYGWTEAKEGNENGQFTLEIRPKPAYSARDKSERKEQPISQLGDLCAARIVIRRQAMPGADIWDLRTLDAERRADLQESLIKTIGTPLFGYLVKKLGRGNFKKTHKRPKLGEDGTPIVRLDGSVVFELYSPRQERIEELAIQEPRESDPGRYDDDPGRKTWEEKHYPRQRDARDDDYVGRRKPNGYCGYQGFVLVPLVEFDEKTGEAKYDKSTGLPTYVLDEFGNQVLVEMELQVTDEISHDHNMNGAGAGRIFFKNDLVKHAGEVMGWRKRVDSRSRRKPKAPVYVTDHETGKIVNITKDPTVSGFFAATGRQVLCPQAYIQDALDHTYSMGIFGHDQRLISGSRVKPAYVPCG